jgi:nicotinamide-nucleotide amidase
MRQTMKTYRTDIIAIGSELLMGGRVESNSIFLSECLAECGLEVQRKISIGDRKTDIQEALRASMKGATIIVLTGGLGSTLDDCTREAVAETFHRSLTPRKKAHENLQWHLRRLGRPVTPLLGKQALIPSGGRMLVNSVGTASGFFMKVGQRVVVALPGVPREAKEMMVSQVQPILRRLFKGTRRYWSHSFNTFGLPETEIQRQLDRILTLYPHIQFGLLASPRGVIVTVSCWQLSDSRSIHKEKSVFISQWNQLVDQVRECLGLWLFSEGKQTMEETVGKLLLDQAWTMALAESCTGGLIAHRLTEVPGSSSYMDRGVVSYSNLSKREFLGVPVSTLRRYGAVSVQVAEAMAKGIRARSRVNLGVGVTGIAGPGGGTVKKPVGLVYGAIDGPRGILCRRWQFLGDRTEIKLKASQAVLDLIRRYANEAAS